MPAMDASRFGLPGVERTPLFFRAPALERDHFALAREARRFLVGRARAAPS